MYSPGWPTETRARYGPGPKALYPLVYNAKCLARCLMWCLRIFRKYRCFSYIHGRCLLRHLPNVNKHQCLDKTHLIFISTYLSILHCRCSSRARTTYFSPYGAYPSGSHPYNKRLRNTFTYAEEMHTKLSGKGSNTETHIFNSASIPM
jgi:hypothetical protein